jgi:hypothetical protein
MATQSKKPAVKRIKRKAFSTCEAELKDPFEDGEIKWMVTHSGVKDENPWVRVVPYLTSRAVQNRLDAVFGMANWENVFQESPKGNGHLCGITVHMGAKSVTKWDGAGFTDIEPFKGSLSDALKRAAVQFGVGRYLYELDAVFLNCNLVNFRSESVYNYIEIPKAELPRGVILPDDYNQEMVSCEWITPQVPDWARPRVNAQTYIDAVANAKTLDDLKTNYTSAYNYGRAFSRKDILVEIYKLSAAKKLELAGADQRAKDERHEKLTKWLDDCIERDIRSATNPRVIRSARDIIRQNLMIECAKYGVDSISLLLKLKSTADEIEKDLK